FARVPGDSLPLLYNYTLSLWVQIDEADISGLSYLFSKGAGADPFAFLIQPTEAPFSGFLGIAGDVGFETEPALQVGTKQHLTLVFRDENEGQLGATQADFYVDGVLAGTLSEGLAGYIDMFNANFVIGANGDSEGV